MKHLFIVALLLLISTPAQSDEQSQAKLTLEVGLVEPERIPYFWRDNNFKFKGLYIDILEEVSASTGVNFNYRFYPHARLRNYVKNGVVDLEPGIDKRWRQEENEAETSVYTRPFLLSKEVYAFAEGHHIAEPTGENLKNKIWCGVKGFNFIINRTEKAEFEPATEQQVLEMLSLGRCQYALVPKLILAQWLNDHPANITYSDTIETYELRFRLHKKHENLIHAFDKVLNRLIDSGKMDEIVNKYTVGNKPQKTLSNLNLL